ncbi:MAG: metallophosphoesterase [Acidobacteria bacterium]|nr:metallophosphoesterase [Acidobacteriota bacterium]
MVRLTVLAALSVAAVSAQSPFVTSPYLQLGDTPKLTEVQQLTILWHAADKDATWTTEFQIEGSGSWLKADTAMLRRIAVRNIIPHRVYGAVLKDLPSGKPLTYRVLLDGKQVFQAAATARKDASQPYRFIVTGDCAQGSAGQKALALQMSKAKPDFVAIAGDIVYSRGLISEYRTKYFPIYDNLIRSIPFLAAPGNHDVGGRDLATYPDGLAYYYYWSQPLNGPVPSAGFTPVLGSAPDQAGFRKMAGEQYPRMANFSMNYANSHWTFLDSNKYVDWSRPELLNWLKQDLAAAQSAKWRFVIFHHPGFNSSKAHFGDQWMRLLAPVFEEAKVDVVFAGHVHNYQRSLPLIFKPEAGPWRAIVDGVSTLDKTYDGATNKNPKGVIYLGTGAGGAGLYNVEQSENRPGAKLTWQPFTAKFVSQIHSMTQVDVNGANLTFRQIAADGKEVDRFLISK